MTHAEWHNWEEYIADVDTFGYPDETDDYCADWYDGDDYSEGLE